MTIVDETMFININEIPKSRQKKNSQQPDPTSCVKC